MKQYNADEKKAGGSLEVIIGGQTFHGIEPTLGTMKELAQRVPAPPDKDAPEGEQLLQSIDSIYPQLEILLRDPETGRPPSKEFIEEHLSMRRAGEIIQQLMGGEADENPR